MSEIVNLPEPDQFGFCPECGHRDECLDGSRGAYFVCHAHRLRWFAGAGRSENARPLSADSISLNDAVLHAYEEVAPGESTEEYF